MTSKKKWKIAGYIVAALNVGVAAMPPHHFVADAGSLIAAAIICYSISQS